MPDEVLMDFAEAMRAVQDGLSVHRASWTDKRARVQLVDGYLSVFMAGGWKQWLIQTEDVKAQDWAV